MTSVGGFGGLLALAALLSLAPGAAAATGAFQADCPCERCISKGNTLADCASFGLDCSCHAGPAPAPGGGGGSGACPDLEGRTTALNDECCNEKTEDCSSGRPATCNLGCAHVLLPFFDDCSGVLGAAGAAQFDGVVKLCRIILQYPVRALGGAQRILL